VAARSRRRGITREEIFSSTRRVGAWI
jgi:hypothetical protein